MDVKSLEGTSKGTRNPVNAVIDTMRQIRNDDANATDMARKSAVTAADNMSVPYSVSPSEEAAQLSSLRARAHSQKHHSVAQASEFWLRACLRARKGDVDRALPLAVNYMKWRRDVKYEDKQVIQSDKVKQILSTGLFAVAGNRTRDDRPILMVRYRFFNPRKFAAIDVARSLGIVVEYLLRTEPNAQSHGVVVLDDVANFTFANFDLRVMRFLERAFTQVLPMRLAAINIVNPGWLVKTVFSIMSGFISKKIQARITVYEAKDHKKLAEVLAKDQIPTFLNQGGSLEWTEKEQKQFVDKIIQLLNSTPHAVTI